MLEVVAYLGFLLKQFALLFLIALALDYPKPTKKSIYSVAKRKSSCLQKVVIGKIPDKSKYRLKTR